MSDQPPQDPAYAGQAPAYGPPPQAPPTYPPQPYPAQSYPPQSYPAPGYPTPQYGTPQQQWPGYPYQGAGYPAPQEPGPSGVTAIIAGVLAILIGLYQGFQSFMYVVVTSVTTPVASEYVEMDWLGGYLIALAIGSVVSALVLLVGGGFLFARKAWARWLVVGGCAVSIVILVSPVLLADLWLRSLPSDIGVQSFYDGVGAFTVFLMVLWIGIPLATAVLALLPATKRYCDFQRR